MKQLFLILTLAALALNAGAADQPEAADGFKSLQWHAGPSTEKIGAQATVKLDSNLTFLDEANTQKFLQLTGNIPSPNNYVLASPEGKWWATFSFDAIGYVKDDEKIDADALLKQLQDSDEPSNEERKRLGMPPLFTEGWYVPPHYDAETKRLEWGIKLRSGDQSVLNYTVRLLGRSGVMNATLVSNPETLDADVKSFKAALQGYEFNSGERYAEFKPGDKVAEYGLAALVVGGGAAALAKTGLLAKFWKLIVAGVIAAGAGIASLFRKRDKSSS